MRIKKLNSFILANMQTLEMIGVLMCIFSVSLVSELLAGFHRVRKAKRNPPFV